MTTTFGDRLRRMRLAAGLSQNSLAGESLSPGYISLLEQGKRHPSDEVLRQLAERLGCSPSELWSGEPSERDQRIELERAYARMAIVHGEAEDARNRLLRLLAEEGLHRRIRDELQWLLGLAHERVLDLAAATDVFQELQDRAVVQETHLPVTMVGIGLARSYLDGGDLHQAAASGETALAAAEAQHLADTDDYYRLAATVMAAYMALGDYLRARAWGERYLQQALEHDRPAGQAALYWNAAILAEQQGRLVEALALCERALGIFGELGTDRDSIRLQLEMASLLLRDDPPQAEHAGELLDRCAEALHDLGSRLDRARWNWLRSTAYLLLGDLEGAELRAREALDVVPNGGPQEQAEAHRALSDVLSAQNRLDDAADSLQIAVSCLDRTQPSRATALDWRDVAERLVETGHTEEAVAAFRRALDGAGIRARSRIVAERIRDLARNQSRVGSDTR